MMLKEAVIKFPVEEHTHPLHPFEPEDMAESCQFCYGSGMEIVSGKGAKRCRCRKSEEHQRLLLEARIPRRYINCSLANYAPTGPPSQQLALKYANRLVEEYPATDRGLLLVGPVGVGKTHLACGILSGLLRRGIPCLFYEFGALLKAIQHSYNQLSQTSEMDLLEPIYQAEVLVLDEIGATRPSEWVRDTMMQIIGNRYNEERLTIITTNYGDIRHSPIEETLEERVGVRLRSRLYQMCKTIVVDGEDHRKIFDS